VHPLRPRSPAHLFWAFSWLSLQGFGGVHAVVQRELVERHQWLSREEFLEDWAVAQILPGPNAVNLSLMVGDRYFGWRGAMAALAGMLAFPLGIVLCLAVLFAGISDMPQVQGMLRGMGAVAAGLVTASGLKLIPALKRNALGTPVCTGLLAATFIAAGWLRLPLFWILLLPGGCSCLWAYRCLGPSAHQGPAAGADQP